MVEDTRLNTCVYLYFKEGMCTEQHCMDKTTSDVRKLLCYDNENKNKEASERIKAQITQTLIL